MAKFSQAFLQGLLQPTYQRGLFEAARDVAQAPAVMGLERKRDERAQQFLNMTPRQRGQELLRRATRSGDVRAMAAAQSLIDSATEAEGNKVIQPLITELSNPETTEERAQELRVEVFDLARANNLKEADVRAAFNAANKSRITTGYEQLLRETQELSIVAKRALSANTSREDFVAQYGEKNGYIYDNEKDLRETAQLNLQITRERVRLETFQYNDEEMGKLGLSDSQITTINGLKTGREKNAAVAAAVKANFDEDTTINASLLNFMAESRVADIAERENLDLGDEDDVIIARSLAKKEVRELYRVGGIEGVINAQVAAAGEATGSTVARNQAAIDAFIESLGVGD